VAYLAFQLYSHPNLYADKGEHVVATTAYVEPKFRLTRLRKHLKERDVEKSRGQSERSESPAITDSNQTHSPEPSTATAFIQPMQNVEEESEEEVEVEEPQLNLWTSVGLLVVVTVVWVHFILLNCLTSVQRRWWPSPPNSLWTRSTA